FREASERLAVVRPLIEAIEARLHAKSYLRAEVVVPRKLTPRFIEEVSAHVAHDKERGLAVAPIFGGRWRGGAERSAPTDVKQDDLPERDLVTFLVERKDVERARRRLAGLGIDHMIELTEVGRLYEKDS